MNVEGYEGESVGPPPLGPFLFHHLPLTWASGFTSAQPMRESLSGEPLAAAASRLPSCKLYRKRCMRWGAVGGGMED